MAATDLPDRDVRTPHLAKRRPLGSIALAACALPGVMPMSTVQAAQPPEQAELTVQVAGYADRQPGLDRLRVYTPSLHAVVPLGDDWSVEGGLTNDEVSGASPRYYTDISGASRMSDERLAGDLRVTRYLDGRSLSLGLAGSTENDYRSRAWSMAVTQDSADRNTTWSVALGFGRDRIDPVNDRVNGERRRLDEIQFGLTQAVSASDLVQVSLTLGRSSGYHSDPYKQFDVRPRVRDLHVLQLRWNHGFADPGGATLRTAWRVYDDSWGVRGHTLELAWVQPVGPAWSLTPSLRGHTQRAASFYVDPVADPSIYPGPVGLPTHFSTDQRLSAFGALTVGVQVSHRIDPLWRVDGSVERYQQRSAWRVGGEGSPGVDALSARTWRIALNRRF